MARPGLGDGNVLVVAPHLDDAAISCGLIIQGLQTDGRAVAVATVFTHAPAGPVSDVARTFNCPGGVDAVRGLGMRRREDSAALKLLGTDSIHLGFYDASMRSYGDDRWVVSDFDDVKRHDATDEPALTNLIAGALAAIIAERSIGLILAPAGVGGHLDHVIVRNAVQYCAPNPHLARTVWYQDLPYAFAAHHERFSKVVRGDRSAMELKLAAIGMYHSQLGFISNSKPWQDDYRLHAEGPDGVYSEWAIVPPLHLNERAGPANG